MQKTILIGAMGIVMAMTACNQPRPPASTAETSPIVPAERAVPERVELQREHKVPSEFSARVKRQAPAVAGVAQDAAVGHFIAPVPSPVRSVDRERYDEFESNGIKLVESDPVSTFSIDVDTASYANVRRMLQEGRLPLKDAVRVEELVNYFRYDDPSPASRDTPFHVAATLAPAPWNSDRQLLRVALKAWDLPQQDLPPSNLVFLIDVSGSMNSADKLPLLKRSIKLLTRRMGADDRISMVVYAGAGGVVLEPTAGDEQATIEAALDELSAGGSTHGSAGIKLAYAKARENFIKDGVNRVILATDGDFNVGTVNQRALLDLIEHEREAGIALTTLGFGRGNLNDRLMEQLADHGNGNYAYIDTLLEAQKVLVDQMGGTLMTVAKDVKIQVEFNPAKVAEYRLVGYENRLLRREDFNNDKIDAGELGAGHSVVALYELTLVGGKNSLIEPLRYGRTSHSKRAAVAQHGAEFAFVRLRYKAPNGSKSKLLSVAVDDRQQVRKLADTSDDFRFSAAVAAFAQHLRGSTYLNDYNYRDILALAHAARGADDHGYRADFIRLVGLAESLDRRPAEIAANDDGQR